MPLRQGLRRSLHAYEFHGLAQLDPSHVELHPADAERIQQPQSRSTMPDRVFVCTVTVWMRKMW